MTRPGVVIGLYETGAAEVFSMALVATNGHPVPPARGLIDEAGFANLFSRAGAPGKHVCPNH